MKKHLKFFTLSTGILLALLFNALPVFAQWQAIPLSEAKFYVNSIAMPGKFFFIGGAKPGFAPTAKIEIYDLKTQTLASVNMPVARVLSGAIIVDTLLYIAGGLNPLTGAVSDRLDIYDIKNDRWKTPLTLSVARASASAVRVGTEIWFCGGYRQTSATNIIFYDAIDVYNLQTGVLSTQKLPLAQNCIAVEKGNKVLFSGGQNAQGAVPNAYIYDVLTKTWGARPLPKPRFNVSSAVAGPYVLFAGGSTFTEDALDDVDIYNSVNNSWSVANLSEARAFTAGAGVCDSLAIFAGGGNASWAQKFLTSSSARVDIFNARTGQWTQTELNGSRAGVFGASDGTHFAVAGGWAPESQSFRSDVEIYTCNTVSGTIAAQLFFSMSATPNPGKDWLYIQFGHPFNGTIHLCDLSGRLVLEQQVNDLQTSLSVGALVAGTYVIEARREDGKVYRMLWVRR